MIKSRRMRWAEHVARMWDRRGVCRALVGKSEGKRPLGKLKRICEENNKMDLQAVVLGVSDCIVLAHDRDTWQAFVNVVMKLLVP